MYVENARYQKPILPEHSGNALIEALPKKLTDEDLVSKLEHYPKCLIKDTQKDASERVEYLTRLNRLRQPQLVYFDVFRAIEVAIKDGYSAKNPLSPTTMNYLHYSLEERPNIKPRSGFFKPKGCGITIIGESGVGKTSMLEQVLSIYPDVINHQSYNGMSLPLTQVVWLKVDCPDDSSVKGLCHRILDEIDRKMGIENTKPHSTIALLIKQIEAKMKSSFLGILVIDEMQNLNTAKAGGAERLLGFLHNLMNNLGIPILFCANPPFDKLLSKTLKAARRAESGGYFDIGLLKNSEAEWGLFVDALWELQWTNVQTPLTQDLSNSLYSLSVGNMDLAVRIFYAAQRAVIGSLDERITTDVLNKGASIAIRSSKPAIDELRLSLLKRKKESTNDKPNSEASEEAKAITESKGKFVTIPGDLSRPHHPELAERITELQYEDDLHALIEDPALIQRVSEEENPLGMLKSEGIFCEDPLKTFG
ncbi:Transposon Tn7 transposition protein TnsC [Shewanella sp. P1-14-1]|uniref:ATP-binding protein n=1 Tax=Shewanella sp. P1-14-1 TaxID=1723761 RepID=UPI0006D679F1|nr:ATP-binding protein [Shewanella sp. P1-14-1]KPZ71253.1 Transposon Tn7 transposition protein TnsC [Shewanella sp. P1-14-1]